MLNANSSLHNSSADQWMFQRYENMLHGKTATLINFYNHSGLPIVIFGTIGHLISLTALFTSTEMQTPSFLYHKSLTVAELSYCANCIVQAVINDYFKIGFDRYNNYAATLYTTCISRIISSVTGYLVLYMTLLIALDRLFVINFKTKHLATNTRKFVLSAIFVTFVVSFFINSWSSAVEYVFVEISKAKNSTNGLSYHLFPRNSPQVFVKWKRVKNIYNSVIRIAYPFALVLITSAVVWGFIRQRTRQRVPWKSRAFRRNNSLFSLLIVTCLLAFVQVIPTETRRILELLYPQADCNRSMGNPRISLDEKMKLKAILIYGHLWTKVTANLCTFFSRSLSFYVYFCFNGLFRTAVIRIFRCQKSSTEAQSHFRQPTIIKRGVVAENSHLLCL